MESYQNSVKDKKSVQDEFLYNMNVQGYYLFEEAISLELLEKLRIGIDKAFEDDAQDLASGRFKSDSYTSDISRLLINRGTTFELLLENNLLQSNIDSILGETCVINNYSAVRLMPKKKNFVANIHRDSPRYSPTYKLAIQILYFIDDFTEQTGGTWVLPGSHHSDEKPSEETFFSNGKQITGKAGTAMIFDSMLWHAAGVNVSDKPRRGIAIVYTRSFIKQQFDMVKAIPAKKLDRFSKNMKRLIGYNVRVPSSLEEFYLPEEQRLYKGGQG
ncbi:MAG: phytanoyl-CoA dioxygenase family protein [Aridibacter sp.]